MKSRLLQILRTGFTLVMVSGAASQSLATGLDCPWNNGGSWRTFLSRDSAASIYVVIADVPRARQDGITWNNSCFHFLRAGGEANVSGYFSDWPYIYYEYTRDPLTGAPNAKRWLPNFSYEQVPQFAPQKPDPTNYKIWAHGDQFTFNEAGELYHRTYGKVGEFRCDVPDRATPCMQGKGPNSVRFWNEGY